MRRRFGRLINRTQQFNQGRLGILEERLYKLDKCLERTKNSRLYCLPGQPTPEDDDLAQYQQKHDELMLEIRSELNEYCK
jgi:hypothetical protein